MPKPIIAADSHVTEAPGTYVDRIAPEIRAIYERARRDMKL